jgi:type VI secretion system Hcp family effector
MMLLDIAGIAGESKSPVANWNQKIQIESMDYGIKKRTTNGKGSGLVASGAEVEAMYITKQMDKSTPQLFVNLAKGEPIPICYVRVVRSGQATISTDVNGALYEAETYTLYNVVISSYGTSGSLGSGGLPMESWSLSFTKIQENYVPTDAKGNPIAGNNAKGFDFAQATPF